MFPSEILKRITRVVSFLGLSFKAFAHNITVRWGYVSVVILDGFCDFESKFLVEIDGIIVVGLNVQVNLGDVLLRALFKNMVQQLRPCVYPEKISSRLHSSMFNHEIYQHNFVRFRGMLALIISFAHIYPG